MYGRFTQWRCHFEWHTSLLGSQSGNRTFNRFFFFFFFFFFYVAVGFEFRASHLVGRCSYHVSHSASLFFFVMGFFQGKVLGTICLGWLWIAILLISASWVAKITGVSHQHLVIFLLLIFLSTNFVLVLLRSIIGGC
jgi:hypothetical protein